MIPEQLAIDFAPPRITIARARALREEGAGQAADHASRIDPTWTEMAFAYLESYALTHRLINPEDVIDSATSWGLSEPPDARAWGSVYLRAVRRNLIERSNVTYQRRKGHASVGVYWRSLVAA